MNKLFPSSLVVLAAVVAGCETPDLPPTIAAAPTTVATPTTNTVDVAGLPGPVLPQDDILVTDVPRKVSPLDPVKGRRSRDAASGGFSLGIGTTAAGGLFAKHKMIYLSIDEANQLYWPQHDFKYPPKHEVFMKEVVELALNGVPLPDLAPGREYIYVPQMGEIGLMIRLTPGTEGSKLDPPEPGKEHIYDYKALAAKGVQVPGLQADGTLDEMTAMKYAKDAAVTPEEGGGAAPGQPAVGAAAGAGGAPPADEPSPNIRERAGQLGNQQNANVGGAPQ